MEYNTSIICPTNGIPRYGTDDNGNRMFIIDLVKFDEEPVVHLSLDVGFILLVTTKWWNEDKSSYLERKIWRDMLKHLVVYRFFNHFIEIVQEIYGSHGVNVNSKHIEMVLWLMTIQWICLM